MPEITKSLPGNHCKKSENLPEYSAPGGMIQIRYIKKIGKVETMDIHFPQSKNHLEMKA